MNVENNNRDAWTFFMGAMVGFFGSVLVTSLFEYVKLIMPTRYILPYWGAIFLFSSDTFFWMIHKTLVRLNVNAGRKWFAIAIGFSTAIGILMIGIGLLLFFGIVK